MPMQTIELALRGLLRERQALGRTEPAPWSAEVGASLRRLLAIAYIAEGDDERAALVLEDLLSGEGLADDQRTECRLALADCRARMGQRREAVALYAQIAEDSGAAPLWRDLARVNMRAVRWNHEHPDWRLKWNEH
jgi:hypothetical protein